MKGNFHVRFLGEVEGAILSPYSSPDVIDTKVGDRPVFEVPVGDIHDLGDGRLTISFTYALSAGESADNLQVWHLNDDGSHTIEQCQYDGSKVTFSTD